MMSIIFLMNKHVAYIIRTGTDLCGVMLATTDASVPLVSRTIRDLAAHKRPPPLQKITMVPAATVNKCPTTAQIFNFVYSANVIFTRRTAAYNEISKIIILKPPYQGCKQCMQMLFWSNRSNTYSRSSVTSKQCGFRRNVWRVCRA
jgi:hypothetical protein